jgi:hypothetical protein
MQRHTQQINTATVDIKELLRPEIAKYPILRENEKNITMIPRPKIILDFTAI